MALRLTYFYRVTYALCITNTYKCSNYVIYMTHPIIYYRHNVPVKHAT